MLPLAVVLLGLNMRSIIASLPPLLADVRSDLGLSATVAGLLTTLPVVCFGALAFVVPRLARRHPLERVLAACALLTAASAAVRGFDTTPALFLGSVGAGVGVAIAQTTMPVLIRSGEDEREGLLSGLFSGALPAGATLAGFTAVPLEDALDGSWAGSLAVWALPGLAAFAAWALLALKRSTRVDGPPPEPLRGEPLAWWVAAYMGIQSMAFFAALAWLPEILQANGSSETEAGALQAFASLVSVPAAFGVPVVASRRDAQSGAALVVAAAGVAGAAGLLAAPDAALLWVALLGLCQGGSLGLGLLFPVVKADNPATGASLTAMTLGFGYLTASLGPWILGVAHDVAGGWTAPLFALLVIVAAQAVPGWVAGRPGTVHAAR